MFDIVKKLMFARQIQFEEGKISMLGGRMVMIPVHIFVALYQELLKRYDYETAYNIMYEAGKQNGVYWINRLKERYRMKAREMLEWGMDSMKLAGWAKFKVIKVDLEERENAIFIAYESAFSSFLGNTGQFSDPLLAGFFGGGGSVIYDKSLVCKETKCISKGNQFCEFIVTKSDDDWLPRYLEAIKKFQ